MIRYFAVATAIVLAGIFVLLALGRHTTGPESSPEPYGTGVAPSAPPPGPGSTSLATGAALEGDAPWALSALPECFRQKRAIGGPLAYVRAHEAGLERAAWKRVRNVRLATADCRLDVGERSAVVVRSGDTRLRVPPDARFYVWDRDLVIDRYANGAESVRVYALRDGSAPAFAAR